MLGVFVSHSPFTILSLPAFVSRSPPDKSCMYPSWISRSHCSSRFLLLVFSYVSALGHSRRRRSRRSSANVRTSPRTDPSRSLGIAANPSDRLRLRGRTSHLDLHRGVERPPGRPQLRGKRRAELALKAPHQRLAHCVIMRWPNPKSGVLAT
jgi:hypothetical protein